MSRAMRVAISPTSHARVGEMRGPSRYATQPTSLWLVIIPSECANTALPHYRIYTHLQVMHSAESAYCTKCDMQRIAACPRPDQNACLVTLARLQRHAGMSGSCNEPTG
jgi:hypothetical protein